MVRILQTGCNFGSSQIPGSVVTMLCNDAVAINGLEELAVGEVLVLGP